VTLPHDEAGSGPALVLLHAGIADRTMWGEHLQPLADAGYRVVALDLPGFGEAPVPPGEQAAWLDVLQTMDDLSIERAALVGSSFGGAVALRMAFVAPERVSALALISAPPPNMEPSTQLAAAWEAEEEALERGDSKAATQISVNTWTMPGAPQDLRERVASMQRRAFELQGVEEPPDASDPLEEDPAALARVDVPALVAAGEHDLVDFTQGAEEMARIMPRARHSVIEGAGHLAPLETPARFRELILGFLR
jgi:pimeloyl-ACP methyl ester carboxylesterase